MQNLYVSICVKKCIIYICEKNLARISLPFLLHSSSGSRNVNIDSLPWMHGLLNFVIIASMFKSRVALPNPKSRNQNPSQRKPSRRERTAGIVSGPSFLLTSLCQHGLLCWSVAAMPSFFFDRLLRSSWRQWQSFEFLQSHTRLSGPVTGWLWHSNTK